jgi:polyhydroxyalkanoate synthase
MPQSPVRREGPRPLPVHLLNLAWTLLSWRAGLPSLKNGSPAWKRPLAQRAEALRHDLADVASDAFEAAVDAESRRRHAAFLDGVAAYRRHPYRRRLAEPPVIWRQGTTRLLDYGNDPAAPTVLLIPSLINRYRILDLMPRRSLARALARQGLRPLVVDWDAPGPQEQTFTLTDYIHRLESALDAITADGRRAGVVGYCMGGLLALALATRRPDRVSGLALLATPWDFHAPSAEQAGRLGQLRPVLELGIAAANGLSPDLQNALFATIDPANCARKFASFADLDPKSAKARDFVALEDWINDGVPLAPAVARECLDGWYGRNDPALGRWMIEGKAVLPSRLTLPTLVLVPGRDRIVAPESALALAEKLPNSLCHVIATGHIGMMTGRLSHSKVYRPLANWLTNVALHKEACPSGTLTIKNPP